MSEPNSARLTRTLLLVILISLVGGMFVCYVPRAGSGPSGPYGVPPTAEHIAALTLSQPMPVFVDSTPCSPRCCNYGMWTAGDFVILYERPDSSSSKSGVVKPQSSVNATRGLMRVHPARFVTNVPVPPPFGAGDTLDVYTPRGDGFYLARRYKSQDEMVEVRLRHIDGGFTDAGRFFGEYRHTWWVFVSGPDGQGWTSETRKFSGPRSCSAPPRRQS